MIRFPANITAPPPAPLTKPVQNERLEEAFTIPPERAPMSTFAAASLGVLTGAGLSS